LGTRANDPPVPAEVHVPAGEGPSRASAGTLPSYAKAQKFTAGPPTRTRSRSRSASLARIGRMSTKLRSLTRAASSRARSFGLAGTRSSRTRA
jgi:hypothetical protein